MEELNLKPLENALNQLAAGLKQANQDLDNDLYRDGVIQRFEYCMDLSWKAIQRYLKVIAQIDEATIRTKKDLFREAARLRLIVDAGAWIEHYEARNETSHVYDRKIAMMVFERAVVFLPDAQALLESLRNAN
jgi:nucleotidyltransferase substrate binding protein (TIGR01987 family)